MTKDDFLSSWMDTALAMAEEAAAMGEVPVAAIIISPEGEVLAKATNRVERDQDPTAHAEILAIRAASKALGNSRLDGCDLWVTLEPCPMCAGAISHARINRLYYGTDDVKSGGVQNGARVFSQSSCHHAPEVYSGISAHKAGEMLTAFFKAKR